MAQHRVCRTCGRDVRDGGRFCAACGSDLARMAAEERQVGRILADRYVLFETLGHGGMTQVYRAEDRHSGATVAVKLYPGGDPEGADRLLHEGRSIARLAHPNVVTLRDVGLVPEGGAYLVLDWIDGRSLASLLADRRPLPLGPALAMGAALTRALAAAHALGILHRDVKPANVMVPRVDRALSFGDARLADFGVQGALEDVAADGQMHTRAGAVVGTPAYMAPEQLLGAPQSAATDLFGLGAVLFEALFGRSIGGDAVGGDVILRRLSAPIELPAWPAVPAALRVLLERLLDREPTHRPQDAGDVARMLADIAAAEGVAGASRLAEPSRPGPTLDVATYALGGIGMLGAPPVLDAPPPPPSPMRASTPPAAMPTSARPTRASGRRLAVGGLIAVLALVALVALLPMRGGDGRTGAGTTAPPDSSAPVTPTPRPAPAAPAGRWRLVAPPLIALAAGAVVFAGLTALIDRRRVALVAQAAGVDASVRAALLGGLPLDREGISRTIATTVEAIIRECRSLDEHLIGQTIVAIAREYGADGSTADSRMAALVQIPQQLERLQQRIAARTTPWYVRHEKLLAALVSGTTILGGLAKTALDLAGTSGAP